MNKIIISSVRSPKFYSFSYDRLNKLIPKEYTTLMMETYVVKALTYYNDFLKVHKNNEI